MKLPLLFTATLLAAASGAFANETAAPAGSDEAVRRIADGYLEKMTFDEKVVIIHGDSIYRNGGVARVGIPQFFPSDGPSAIRPELDNAGRYINAGNDTDCATAFPTGSALAATWDTRMARLFGDAIGSEARARGKDMSLGPAINIMRTPINGRTFEYMGEDPYLVSRLCPEIIRGVQAHDVSACIKHFALNNQELDRSGVNVRIDERALREIYLPGFEAAVKEGGTWGLMGAYNRFRGEWCCENRDLLQGILRDEWGYKGVVISDWGAIHDALRAIRAGTDMDSGNGNRYKRLGAFVRTGAIPESPVDTAALRMLELMVKIRKIGPEAERRSKGEINTTAHQAAARAIAQESIVLLKNDGAVLPLDAGKIKTLLVVGRSAKARHCVGIDTRGACDLNLAGGSGEAKPPYEITAFDGIVKRLGGRVKVDFAEAGAPDLADRVKAADAVILFTGNTHADEQEGKDRADIKLPAGQDQMVETLAGLNPRTVLVNQSGAPVAMPWSGKVPAVVQYWFSGMEGGDALAAILFGDASPSGKLPCTFPRQLADVPAHAMKNYKAGEEVYAEGLLVGYRWFDTKKVEPLFPFGHGLAYTTFTYGAASSGKDGDKFTVSIPVTNTGKRAGAEVVQLYLHENAPKVERPEQELKGFARLELAPGETKTATFTLTRRDFSYWSVKDHGWKADPGTFEVRVGASSRDIRAKSSVTLDK